jgi:L-arabinokinase
MVIVCFISGHGFGHAARDVEVINAIVRQHPDAQIVVRTSVPRWFLEESVARPIEVQVAEVDTGMVQIDSLTIDEHQTIRRAAGFYADFAARVETEAALLRNVNASVVIGDIPPLASAAASLAGVPSVALGNFTWDWIYAGLPELEALAPEVLPRLADAYRRTTLALRLPLHGGFESMPEVRDIPLIARRSTRERDDVRRALALSAEEVVVLPSFGGFGLSLPYQNVARGAAFTLLLTDHEASADVAGSGLRIVGRRELAGLQLRYEDLVAAADVVVSKPGYGIVSECIANDTALLYTSRGRFAEQDVFVREMPTLLRCEYLPPDDLRAGRWAGYVEALLERPRPTASMSCSGAEVAASEILSLGYTRDE